MGGLNGPRLTCRRLPGRPSYAAARAVQEEQRQRLEDEVQPGASLFLLQHASVYTLGRATRPEHLSCPEAELAAASGAEVVRADRGGSVTYHGPGQATGYLLLNLKACGIPLHRHLWNLEEAGRGVLHAFGLAGQRVPGMTGLWCREAGGDLAKVCTIGVGCRRWVTYHGLCLNVDLDLAPFERIDPCGLGRRPVTTLARLLGRPVSVAEVERPLAEACGAVLGMTVEWCGTQGVISSCK